VVVVTSNFLPFPKVENWMAEKLQLATEESYRDPANIQSKHQKHQAFEAELAANADRIQVEYILKIYCDQPDC